MEVIVPPSSADEQIKTPWRASDTSYALGFTTRRVPFGSTFKFKIFLQFARIIEDSTFFISSCAISFTSLPPILLEASDFAAEEDNIFSYERSFPADTVGATSVTSMDVSVVADGETFDINVAPQAQAGPALVVPPCQPFGVLFPTVHTIRPPLDPAVTVEIPKTIFMNEWTPLVVTSMIGRGSATKPKLTVFIKTTPSATVYCGRLDSEGKQTTPTKVYQGQQMGIDIGDFASGRELDRLAVMVEAQCHVEVVARLKVSSDAPGDMSLQTAECTATSEAVQAFTIGTRLQTRALNFVKVPDGLCLDRTDVALYTLTMCRQTEGIEVMDVAFSRPGVTALTPSSFPLARTSVFAARAANSGPATEKDVDDNQTAVVTWRRTDGAGRALVSTTTVALPPVHFMTMPVTIAATYPVAAAGGTMITVHIHVEARPGLTVTGQLTASPSRSFMISGPREVSTALVPGASSAVWDLQLLPLKTGDLDLPHIAFTTNSTNVVRPMKVVGKPVELQALGRIRVD
ncbi:Gryzun, putative trafficking through Golgi [Carpediemonas membranifera]|uniref:Gryzun, putative trafficking through Golgi n=1 Tax=Carpediemonas membranifera TaxID=201153 RepID=A0A8J6B0W9_9EUKA|nr:Gryzun, putative trafficking through Golgi [Carpediemonas membranifera]|eukprot:KAG9390569.1 Gryzun, putative trafficking through Golgi [Carpediemonas membranifera]